MKRLFFILFLLPLFTQAQIINTVAGNGGTANTGDGGQATAAGLTPVANCIDKFGNMYIVCGAKNIVRKVSPSGIITTVAGDAVAGTTGSSGDEGQATAALLNRPMAVTTDANGDVYICDGLNDKVRKITIATGIITTFAGDAAATTLGDGGPATAAGIGNPSGICIDGSGNVYIADYDDALIRKVDNAGIITSVAGNSLAGYSGDGGPATAAQIDYPFSLCIDGSGNLYFHGNNDYRVRKVTPSGIISTFAGNGSPAMAGDGGPATAAGMSPASISCDRYGNIFISEHGNKVRMINPSGTITLVAGTTTYGFTGDGGLADTATLHTPMGTTSDTCGNLYICDYNNHRVREVFFYPSCGPAAVPEIPAAGSMALYPNPTHDILNVEMAGTIGSVQIAITNLLGQVVYKEAWQNAGQEGKKQINVSGLPKGVYVARVNGTITRKFVKE